MKNLSGNINNAMPDLIDKKDKQDLNFKRFLNSLVLQLDALSFFLIMLGGIMAIGKDLRVIGVVIVVAGFAGLFVYNKKVI